MSKPLRFADYELDLAAYALRRGDQPVKLERIPMEVLILLVRRAGALLPRSEIQAALWGRDVFVDHDAAINTAIRKIRQAIEDDAAAPRFVETVVGKGYRFLPRVDQSTSAPYVQSSVEPTNPPPAQSRRAFPRYSLTRGKEEEFLLEVGETLLGRDPAAEVCIDHPSVSRRHASVSIAAGEAVIRDLGSRNGTFVNGSRIDGPARIEHRAIVGLGAIALTFLILAAPASTQPMTAGRDAD